MSPFAPLLNTVPEEDFNEKSSLEIQHQEQEQEHPHPTAYTSMKRMKFFYRDEQVRMESNAATRRTFEALRKDSHCSSTQIRLALKALKYRRVLDRAPMVMRELNVADPSVDVQQYLGVEWCKV